MHGLYRLKAYWLMIHPYPVVMVLSFATILAIATARNSVDLDRLIRTIATLFFSQAIVGITNDYHDQDFDERAQPFKPLVSGLVTPDEARALVVLAFFLMLVFALSLGPVFLVLALLGTLTGLAYNFGLKQTRFSWLPYLLGFVVLLAAVWIGIERFDARELYLLPSGLLLLFGVHLAHALPDIESDSSLGIGGLAVVVGKRASLVIAWGALVSGQLLSLGTAILLGSEMVLVLTTFVACFLLVSLTIALYWRYPTNHTLRLNFRLVALSSVILAAGWLVALK